MKICHFILGLLCLFAVIEFTGCVSSRRIENSEISPVYVTNTKKYYLMSPEMMDGSVEKQQLLSGKFGDNEFELMTYLMADNQGIYISMFNDFGVGMGSINYDGIRVQFDSAIFPKKFKAEYIVADLQFAYYAEKNVQAALSELGLTLTVEKLENGFEVRKVMNGKDVIEEISLSENSTSIKNLLRGYEFHLQGEE